MKNSLLLIIIIFLLVLTIGCVNKETESDLELFDDGDALAGRSYTGRSLNTASFMDLAKRTVTLGASYNCYKLNSLSCTAGADGRISRTWKSGLRTSRGGPYVEGCQFAVGKWRSNDYGCEGTNLIYCWKQCSRTCDATTGACVGDTVCPTGQSVCNGNICINTLTDNNNCGTCGNACTLGTICQNGNCVSPCTDSDNGQNYFMQGTTCYGSTCFQDKCADDQLRSSNEVLIEYYCEDGNLRSTNPVTCDWLCNDGACYEEGTLLLDEISGLMVEPMVLYYLNNFVYPELDLCDDCNLKQTPTVSILGLAAEVESTFSVFLHGKKITAFWYGILEGSEKTENDPDGAIIGYKVNGTNSLKVLISTKPSDETIIPGNYFTNSYHILNPNEETILDYSLERYEGDNGVSYMFVTPEDQFTTEISTKLDEIAQAQSELVGLPIQPYYLVGYPNTFDMGDSAGGSSGEQHIFYAYYGGKKLFDNTNGEIFFGTIAHEYGHMLQTELGLDTYPSFLREGMTDAMAIFNGFRTWNLVGIYENLEPGCSSIKSHALGRCIFKHLEQEGLISTDFFYKLANPDREYLLNTCPDDALQNSVCMGELNQLLSYSTGQDMTQFMREKLLANI